MTYRPEINGLRAIAVLSVIVYHFNFLDIVKIDGGFLGVDIFFVISGYLITSIILKELYLTGKFSFNNFYEKRARRILPVLIIVIFFSILLAWIFLFPTYLIEFSKSALHSIGFISNYYFYDSKIEYAAEQELLKPLLHTWSLSVEEQYYIFFPIILLFLFRFLKEHLLLIFVIGFLLSLQTSELTYEKDISMSFYFLHTRMWELLAGSILAYLEIKKKISYENKLLNLTLPVIGLSLILISLIFFSTDMPHLPYYTILPITGVSLVICFSNSYSGVGKILSNKLFVGTGLISYSLYLWHFPVLIFAKIFNGGFEAPLKAFTNITLLIIIFILSIATYFFIEKPFRNKKKISIYYFLVLVMGSILLIIITCSIIIVNKGFIERNKITDTYILDSGYYHAENHDFELTINYNNTNGFVETSNSESTLKKKNVLIVGNSHAEDTYESFFYNRNLFKNFNFALISPTSRTEDINYQVHCFYKLITKNLTLCDQYKYDGNTISQYKNSDIIIFSTKWAQKDVDILDKIIKILRQDKKKIIITNNIIESNVTGVFSGYRGLNLLDFFVFQKKRMPNNEELLKIEKKMYSFIKNMNLINEELKNIANNNNVKYLRKEDFLCNHQLRTCDLLTPDGYKIFWDDAHITKEGARYLGKKIHNINWFKF